MSGDTGDEALRHLVIVRRKRGGDHDGHHGGAWKIAYADFMTAMMAFFLVMWLVNMTDDKKIVQIAAYFNPLRLTDKSPSQKGVKDANREDLQPAAGSAKEKSDGNSGSDAGATSKEPSKADKLKEARAKAKAAQAEAELFVDPLATLDKIAEKAPPQPAVAGGGMRQWGAPEALSGSRLHDPFDPVQRVVPGAPPSPRAAAPDRGRPAEKRAPRDQAAPVAKAEADKKQPPSASAPAAEKSAEQSAAERTASAIEREIRAAMLDFKGPRPEIEVKATPEGVLISLSDDIEFGMFASASAQPLPAAVQFMGRIGDIVKDRKGVIVVRGHTDSRPYRSAAYDNWRLSTARAHMAQYMLIRAGVPADRIARVEGHADRHPIDERDKESARNRRIEILLKVDGP